MYFLMQIRTEIKFWKPLEVGRIKFFGQKLCHRSCVLDCCIVYSFVSLGNRDWNNKKLHKNSLKKIGENKNNNKEFKTNVAHQYGTILKPAELQDIKIHKVGTVTKLSKPIKITTQNIKKRYIQHRKYKRSKGRMDNFEEDWHELQLWFLKTCEPGLTIFSKLIFFVCNVWRDARPHICLTWSCNLAICK